MPAIDAAMLIICIQLLISTLVSGDVLSGLPKIAGVLYGILVFYPLVRLLKSRGLIRTGIAVFLAGGLAITAIGRMGSSWQRSLFLRRS